MPQPLPLNTSLKHHLFIAGAAGLWITLFLVVVGPFDTAPLSMGWRGQVMIGYGIIFFLSYTLMVLLQNGWFLKFNRWTWFEEVAFYLCLFTICLPACYGYYASDLINGDYGSARFALEIYLPTLLILLPLLVILRRTVNKLPAKRRSATANEGEVSELETWKPKIERLMAEHLYLDPELSLKSMAERLGTNSSVLSRVINQGYEVNFNDFINAYRVKAVRRALENGDHHTHTLPGIAQNCGFSSKATFNRAFKKHCHLSPSAYLRQLENGQGTVPENRSVSNDNSGHPES